MACARVGARVACVWLTLLLAAATAVDAAAPPPTPKTVPHIASEFSATVTLTDANGTETSLDLQLSLPQVGIVATPTGTTVRAVMRFQRSAEYITGLGPCKSMPATGKEMLLTQWSVMEAPGTVYNGTGSVDGRPCDRWVNPIGHSLSGVYMCVVPQGADGSAIPLSWAFKDDYGKDLLSITYHTFTAAAKPFPASDFAVPDGCTPLAGPANPPVGLHDDFDTGTLSSTVWLPEDPTINYAPGAIVVQSGNARSGKYCANITVHPGDVSHDGGFGKRTERAELDMPMYPVGGRKVAYAWSMLLPKEFPIVPTRLVVAQWKQSATNTQSPNIAMRFVNGRLYATVRNLTRHLDDGDEVAITMMEKLELGVWHDFEFAITWSDDPNSGHVEAYLNDTKVVDYYGQNLASGAPLGFVQGHWGLYRDAAPVPWSMLLDSVVVASTW